MTLALTIYDMAVTITTLNAEHRVCYGMTRCRYSQRHFNYTFSGSLFNRIPFSLDTVSLKLKLRAIIKSQFDFVNLAGLREVNV